MLQFVFWFILFCIGLKLLLAAMSISSKVIYAALDKPGNYPENFRKLSKKPYHSPELAKHLDNINKL